MNSIVVIVFVHCVISARQDARETLGDVELKELFAVVIRSPRGADLGDIERLSKSSPELSANRYVGPTSGNARFPPRISGAQ